MLNISELHCRTCERMVCTVPRWLPRWVGFRIWLWRRWFHVHTVEHQVNRALGTGQ